MGRGVRAEFLPDKYPEFGQCVHKVVHHPKCPERLFLQNHWGLYRSDDWGDSWTDIANGVPSDFGFAMQMHPRDPDTVYIVPLESDMFRCTPEAKLPPVPHDSWVIGDEQYVSLRFLGAERYAR